MTMQFITLIAQLENVRNYIFFKMGLKLTKDLHTLIYVNLKRIGLLYANLELVPNVLKLRRAGTIISHVKMVFAYHAKLVK
jgi:hypothetical protein